MSELRAGVDLSRASYRTAWFAACSVSKYGLLKQMNNNAGGSEQHFQRSVIIIASD